LNLPNLITIGRILLVPVIVWAIGSGQMQIAFLVFLIAGVSDGVDGFLAKRLGMTSNLGAHLDPLADKVLIVSIYVALGITEAVSALDRHPGGVAGHFDCRRRHAGMVSRQGRYA